MHILMWGFGMDNLQVQREVKYHKKENLTKKLKHVLRVLNYSSFCRIKRGIDCCEKWQNPGQQSLIGSYLLGVKPVHMPLEVRLFWTGVETI